MPARCFTASGARYSVTAPLAAATSRRRASSWSAGAAWRSPAHSQFPAASKCQTHPSSWSKKPATATAAAGGMAARRTTGQASGACRGARSRIQVQHSSEASGGRTSAEHPAGTSCFMLRVRSLTDDFAPSSRAMVSDSPAKVRASWRMAVSAAPGRKARPEGSQGEEAKVVNRLMPSAVDRPQTAKLAEAGGAGRTLKLSSVKTDRVPQEPAASLLRS